MGSDMNETAEHAPSFVSRLLARIGNPLNWSVADRVLLIACVVTPLTIWYLVIFHYLMAHPDIASYIDRTVLAVTIRFQTVLVAVWGLLLIVTALLRRRAANSKWFVHALVSAYVWTVVYFTFLIGPFTSIFMPAGLLAGVAVGLIMLDARIVVPWVLIGFALIFGIVLLEQGRWIPYAPLLLRAPFEDGHLHGSWILTIEAVGLSLLPITCGLFYYLISSWHTREDQLVQTKELLTRANGIISRYVPAQVAEGILSNDFNPALKYERRKITVVFSDVRNFTEIADKLEPEEMSRVLNEYLSEMALIADRHGGTLDQFLGDGVLIYFGAPTATDDKDHAVRAIRMGLEMQARVRELSAKWQDEILEHPFEIRIGVNTGHASVGNFGSAGRMAYMAVGRPINLAARLQTHCTPGRILMSHATWLLVRDRFPCEEKGEITVKGTHFPVKVYELAMTARTSGSAAHDS
jgi:adenylate cyclase